MEGEHRRILIAIRGDGSVRRYRERGGERIPPMRLIHRVTAARKFDQRPHHMREEHDAQPGGELHATTLPAARDPGDARRKEDHPGYPGYRGPVRLHSFARGTEDEEGETEEGDTRQCESAGIAHGPGERLVGHRLTMGRPRRKLHAYRLHDRREQEPEEDWRGECRLPTDQRELPREQRFLGTTPEPMPELEAEGDPVVRGIPEEHRHHHERGDHDGEPGAWLT